MVFDDHPGTEHLGVLLTQEPVKPERALETKGDIIDSQALTGTPMTVGSCSVVSGFGANYELGKPLDGGDSQVYISNQANQSNQKSQDIAFEVILNHSKNGDTHAVGTTGSSNNNNSSSNNNNSSSNNNNSSSNNNNSSSSNSTSSNTGAGDVNAQIAADPNCYGILPPYLLKEMAKRNPGAESLGRTLDLMKTLPDESGTSRSVGADEHSVREVYDAQGGGKEALPGVKARFEGDAPTNRFETDRVYEYTGQVRDFYKELFDRDSVDGNGMKMVSTENFGHNFENAFWNGAQMTYGSPSADSPVSTFVLLDVCGHEITHGVTSAEQPLTYYGQAGALNESISDVFGILIKQKSNHQSVADASWVMGEGVWKAGIHGRGLRDLLHPGTAYDDPKVGKDIQPANMSDYIKTPEDHGGVHLNSGIPNRAFALFATDVGGNAWEEPAKIWYETRKVVGPNPSFAQFAYYSIESAKKLGFDDDVPKLEKAWDAVGVTPSDSETDTLTPPAPTPPEAPRPSS
jgi:hypothetical protein